MAPNQTNSHKHEGNLRILFWNARSICNHLNELEHILKKVDIFACVESWLKPEKNIQFPGFVTFRQDRIGAQGGGLLILIRKTLAFKELSGLIAPNDSVELCGLHFNNINPPFKLLLVYRVPGFTLQQPQWDTIFNNINIRERYIIMGDFNAHHVCWNCVDTDRNGERLLQVVEDKGLIIHNIDSTTRIDVRRQIKSNIDLIITTLSLAEKINVTVKSETLGSDHFPININLNAEKHIYHKKTFKIDSLRTDWTEVEKYLDTHYTIFLSANYDLMDPKKKYETFVELLTKAVKYHTPQKKLVNSLIHKNPVRWWDEECYEIKKNRKLAYKKYIETKEMRDLFNYNKITAQARKLFKTKKRDCFKEFASTINFSNDITHTWNTAKILKDKWVKNYLTNTTENLQQKEKIYGALDKLCPSWVPTNPNLMPHSIDNDFFDRRFDFVEFNIALSARNCRSAPGMDGISYRIIKKLPIKYKLILLDIYNAIYTHNKFPTNWKKSYLHFIDKPDKKSVRPIALSSCMCKLFEVLVKNRLQWWLESRQIIPSSQSGFRRGQSCTDNLASFLLYVDDGLSNQRDTLATFLDVQGAFDNVLVDILLDKLAEIGCSKMILNFIKHITYEREITTDILGEQTKLLFKGVPQGGVLSPLLYVLYVANITNNIPKSVGISQFADDIALYLKNKSLDRSKNLLVRSIKILKENLLTLGLELCPQKTKLIHFNKKNIAPGSVEIELGNNCIIKSCDQARFLGIIFDYKLTFSPHVNHLQKRSLKSLNIINFLRGTWWGCDPETLTIFYKSYVRSLIDYGSFIYFPTTKKLTEQLEKIQYKFIRAALGYRRSTPLNVLLGESKLSTIKHRAEYLGNNYFIKVQSNQEMLVNKATAKVKFKPNVNETKLRTIYKCIKTVNSHKGILNTQDRYIIYNNDYDIFKTIVPTEIAFGQSLKNIVNKNSAFHQKYKNDSTIHIYTDGSKCKDAPSAGAACVCDELQAYFKISIHNTASIFTAECIALNKAMDIALANPGKDFRVFSDSLSALSSLQNLKYSIKVNPYIVEILKKYIEFESNGAGTIEFIWIPAHVGITGNENADHLAKLATKSPPDRAYTIPFTDFREIFKKKCYSETTQQILDQSSTTGKKYFEVYFQQHRTKPWYYKTGLPRRTIVTINRLRANHHSLAVSLLRIKVVDSARCECGFHTQDPTHVLWYCPLYIEERKALLIKLQKHKFQPYDDISTILKKPDIPGCKLICNFFEKIDLFI